MSLVQNLVCQEGEEIAHGSERGASAENDREGAYLRDIPASNSGAFSTNHRTW